MKQYSSGTGHYVVKSKRSALYVVKAGVYVRVGHIEPGIVDRAHLAAPTVFPTSVVETLWGAFPG